MNIKICSFLLLICGTLPFAYSYTYNQASVKSSLFEPLRPKDPPKVVSAGCGSVVTEPYGVLEKTYKRGELKDGASCTYVLRAPANHVVNIISVGFDLLDRTRETPGLTDYAGSQILLHDKAPEVPNTLSTFTVSEYQHASSAFVASTSSKEELEVEIVYHDNKDYATQKIYVKYEFLNVDAMKKALQG